MFVAKFEKMTVEEFLDWHQHQEHRHELVDGYAVLRNDSGDATAMAGANEAHGIASNNIAVSLTPQVRSKGCRTFSGDMAVTSADGRVRYPDVLVACGPKDLVSLTSAGPTLVVEILSKSNGRLEFVNKLDEYRENPDLRYILLVDPRRVEVKLYARGGADEEWRTSLYHDLAETIELPLLGAELALASIYEDLDPKPYLELVAR